MTVEDMMEAVNRFSPEEKARFLARFAFELTIMARNTYVPGSDDVQFPSQLRAVNEIQHRVTQCLCDVLAGHAEEVWMWEAVAHFSRVGDCTELVTNAGRRALDSVRPHVNRAVQ